MKYYVFLLIILLFSLISKTYSQSLQELSESVANINIFIETKLNKKEFFEKESFVYCFYLVKNKNIELNDLQLLSYPSFISLKSKEIPIEELSYYDTIIDGLTFSKALLNRFMLTPSNPGTYHIDPIIFEAKISLPIDDTYKNLYRSEAPNGIYTFSYILKSISTEIIIKKIPESPDRPVFIGDFNLD